MDHKNLEYFMTAQKLNHCQACWSLFLSQFDFNLSHHPGTSNAKPDILSRCSDHKKGVEDDNKNIVLLKPEFFENKITAAFVNPPLMKKIAQEQKKDAESQKLKEVNTDKWKTAHFAGWDENKEGIILWKEKVFVPESCKAEVLKMCHDVPTVGHPGYKKTLELVQRSFYWEGLAGYVEKYVQS